MRRKYYFCDEMDEECVYELGEIISYMKENKLNEAHLHKPIRMTGVDYYFCDATNEVCIHGEEYYDCGKECENYLPYNGKSGCCRHRKSCYEPDDKMIVIDNNGKIINKTK